LETNREGEEAATPKKAGKTKSSCERDSIFNNMAYQAMQIMLGIVYFLVCLIGVLAHLSNYNSILGAESSLVAKPSAIKDHPDFASTNKFIKTIDIVEIAMLVIIVVDVVVKLSNHALVMRSKFSNKDTEEE
jgi:hypothetical protein